MAIDGSGNIIVSDTLNHVIRTITTGGATSLLAGSPGNSGNTDAIATSPDPTKSAKFNVPSGITVRSGTFYVVDTNNNRIRTISAAAAPTISGGGHPGSQSVTAGNTASFTVSASGVPAPTYQWQISTDSGGSWNNLSNGGISGGTVSGATLATLQVATSGTTLNGAQFRAVASNGVTPNATSNAALLTVNQGPSITNSNTAFFVAVSQPLTGATITASGSPAPTFGYTGGFPNWASLNTTTGAITGTPPDTVGSPFSFSVTATNTAGSSSPVTFTITVQTGPSINSQPSNQNVQPGQPASFSVQASSTPAVSGYQWQRSTDSGSSWSDLSEVAPFSGTTTQTLTIAAATLAMNNERYRVIVTNSVGSSTSNPAILTVSQAPAFTSSSSTTFVVNEFRSFAVTATGSPAPAFGYSGSFPPWASLNTSTGVISGTPTDTNNSPFTFTLTATNAGGTATQSFTLTVSATPLAPQITTQPTAQSVGLGQNATFTVAATGNPAPTYQWQRYRSGDSGFVALSDSGAYSGTTTNTLTVSNVTSAMGGDLFQVVITNTNGSVTSNSVQLDVTLGTVWATVAGQVGVTGYADGQGTAAKFLAPNALAIDAAGNAFVADAGNHVIRKVTPEGVVTTFAGVAGSPGSTDTDVGNGVQGKFNQPSAVAFDSSGNLYVADTGNHVIRKVSSAGFVTTVAGLAGTLGYADGIGNTARFSFPSGIAVDNVTGIVYVADSLNHVIRKIVGGNVVQPFAGTPQSGGAVDGSSGAKFNFPNGLAVDASSNVYVADARNHAIRKISPTGAVSTFAGLLGSAGTAAETFGAGFARGRANRRA